MSFAVYLGTRKPRPSDALSKRQLEVLFWRLHGFRNREVAGIIGIGLKTAATHWEKGIRKLGIRPPNVEFKLIKYRE